MINPSEEQKESKWDLHKRLRERKKEANFDLANLKRTHKMRKAQFKMKVKYETNDKITQAELETRCDANDEITMNEMNVDVAASEVEASKLELEEFKMKHEEEISQRAYEREEMRLR